MFTKIRKRDGREAPFDDSKITDAIFRAARAVGGEDRETAVELTLDVLRTLKQQYNGGIFGVEDVQDIVEKVLIEKGHAKTAKAYILYRDRRTRLRDAKGELMDVVEEIVKETDRDNANVGNGASAKMLQIASAASRRYYLNRLIDEDYSLAHSRGDIHIHDLDFYATTANCLPGFEYTLIRDCEGETHWVRFDYFDRFFEKFAGRIEIDGDVEVLPLDNYQVYGRTGWTKINKVMRRNIRKDEPLYVIRTRKGLSLHLTGLHKVPVIRDGRETLVEAQDIQSGDKLLASKHELDEAFEIPVLDLFVEHLKQIPFGITVRNAHKLIHWLRYRYDDFRFKLTVGAKQSHKGGSVLSGEEYLKIASRYPIPYEIKRELSITTSKGGKSLPAYLSVTPELLRLLGYILSEGSISIATSKRSIIIGNQDPAILADIDHCVKVVLNDSTATMYKDVRKTIEKGRIINGSVFVAFLYNVLSIKTNAAEMDIPDFVMQASPEFKGNFLQGLFDGDGHYGKNRISYCTVSEYFARKLVLLLKSIGVESHIQYQNVKGSIVVLNGEPAGVRNYDNYIVNLLDVSSMQSFLQQVPSYRDVSRTTEYAFTIKGRNLDGMDVVKIGVRDDYKGRVYDLETEEHWFIVNDYVVHNCLQIPLETLLQDGFNTGHGHIRPPKRPATATALAAIILQSSQNDMFGGQSFPFFDKQIAPSMDDADEDKVYQAMEALVFNLNSMHCLPYDEQIWVFDTREQKMIPLPIGFLFEHFESNRFQVISLNVRTGVPELKYVTAAQRQGNHRRLITLIDEKGKKVTTTDNHRIMYINGENEIAAAFPEQITSVLSPDNLSDPLSSKIAKVKVKQVLESNSNDQYVYDISVADNETFLTARGIFVHNSRAGSQVPFSSINLGTDTSEAGRRATRNFLLAYEAGLGRGENPIFPNVIFRVQKGVSMDPGDPNHDLFQLAVRVASKRLNPTFSFMDSSFNKPYDDQVAYMGCRTRTMDNRRGPSVTTGRGNLSFTTINLPRLGIRAERNMKTFYRLLDEVTELVINQLYHRFRVQCRLKVKDMPFVMGQGLYLGSGELKQDDSIEPAIVNGTLTVGFIGLAEMLVAMTGYHHGQSREAQQLGLEVVQYLRKKTDEASERFNLNYTLLATPAEGTCSRFIKMDRKEYGIIPGVTNQEYNTNSFHIPVHFPVSVSDKISLEGPYHKYCNAGHISYVEFASPPQNNPEAVEAVIRHMAASDMGYAGINYPVDFCSNCGLQGVINEPDCPRCGSADIRRIRRITGYLSTIDRFNDGKADELKHRLPHS